MTSQYRRSLASEVCCRLSLLHRRMRLCFPCWLLRCVAYVLCVRACVHTCETYRDTKLTETQHTQTQNTQYILSFPSTTHDTNTPHTHTLTISRWWQANRKENVCELTFRDVSSAAVMKRSAVCSPQVCCGVCLLWCIYVLCVCVCVCVVGCAHDCVGCFVCCVCVCVRLCTCMCVLKYCVTIRRTHPHAHTYSSITQHPTHAAHNTQTHTRTNTQHTRTNTHNAQGVQVPRDVKFDSLFQSVRLARHSIHPTSWQVCTSLCCVVLCSVVVCWR